MQIHKLAENVGLALLVGLGYAISGWLSIKLAVPPGYTTPAFPPAGIALSAMLIFGARVWPGILAGALVVQFIAHLAVGISQAPLAGLLIPTFGAVLQAAAGAWLARWLIGFPNRLDSPRTIVRFLVLVAPIGSLVNASLSVPALHAAGIITTQEMAFNWWTWWLGDTLGVIVMAPLMFVLFGRPSADWDGRRLGVAIPLGLALAILAFAFRQVLVWEELRVQAQFTRDTEHLASQVRKRLDAQIDMMLAIRGLMSVSENVSHEEFQDFVRPWLDRYPGTKNFAWNARVLQGQRALRDPGTRIGSSGLSDPRPGYAGEGISRRRCAGIPADRHVAPLEHNASAIGINPMSLSPRRRPSSRAARRVAPSPQRRSGSSRKQERRRASSFTWPRTATPPRHTRGRSVFTRRKALFLRPSAWTTRWRYGRRPRKSESNSASRIPPPPRTPAPDRTG
ncbi:MASE1 domain-containing protein [Thauera humireducens]|uniref:MASE1 domain-containing protein n=1 Tax=Thauera humireducens TaxID=1134435 RepID=UPI00311FF500